MIKYEVKEETFEIKCPIPVDYSEKDIIDEYYNQRGFAPNLIGSFDNEEEAVAEYNKCYPSTSLESASAGHFLLCKVIILETNEYYDNEDQDFFQGVGSEIKAEAFLSGR